MNAPISPDSISQPPDLDGKVAIVTGGSSGVGRDLCKQLLLKNAKVYMADESQDRVTVAIAEIAMETDGKYAQLLHLDLADLDVVNDSAEGFLRKETSLHILFCVADTVCSTKDKYTAQGYDMHFGANALGHLLFIRKLHHLLVSSATPEYLTRVVWAYPSFHSRYPFPFNYEVLRDSPARSQRCITPRKLHDLSKFAIVQLGLYMSRTTLEEDGVVMIIVDSRAEAEALQKYSAIKFFKKPFRPSERETIPTYLYAATCISVDLLELQTKVLKSSPTTKDETAQQEMWDFCERVIRDYLTQE